MDRSSPLATGTQAGHSLVELLLALMIGAMLITGLNNVVGIALDTREVNHDRQRLLEQGQFALHRMTMAVRHSEQLMLPLVDNPSTDWPENIREQSFPASPPVGSSTFASAVLAVALPAYSDLDNDGTPDADDDADGRLDEDMSTDSSMDGVAGIHLIDDDGDGSIDEGDIEDDDEDGAINDDIVDDTDNDSDGSIDEDAKSDMTDDGCAGICGLDDDDDGSVDESDMNDDDEDGFVDEDWVNPVVFHLDDGKLVERTPVPWDTGNGVRDGLDYIESLIADFVASLRIERIGKANKKRPLIDITLELTDDEGNSISLNTRIRLGSAL